MIDKIEINLNKTSNYTKMLKDIMTFTNKYVENIDYNIIIYQTEENTNLSVNNKEEKIEESVENIDTVNNSAQLKYTIPKSVIFTQRFQDRIRKDIIEILDSVYPNYFTIDNILFDDNYDDSMTMIVNISADINNDKALKELDNLDKNVEFIVKDLVDYYLYK